MAKVFESLVALFIFIINHFNHDLLLGIIFDAGPESLISMIGTTKL
jgi:hypothetical protein